MFQFKILSERGTSEFKFDLPNNTQKIEIAESSLQLRQKAAPFMIIAVCAWMACVIFKLKAIGMRNITSKWVIAGFVFGFLLTLGHKLLCMIVYPKEANVTIVLSAGRLNLVTFSDFPLKRNRIVLMCLLPFVLSIVPLIVFAFNQIGSIALDSVCIGMSIAETYYSYVEAYIAIYALTNTGKNDELIYCGGKLYAIED